MWAPWLPAAVCLTWPLDCAPLLPMGSLQYPGFERGNLVSVQARDWFIFGLGSTSGLVTCGQGGEQSDSSNSWGAPTGLWTRWSSFFKKNESDGGPWTRLLCSIVIHEVLIGQVFFFLNQFIDFKKWGHLVKVLWMWRFSVSLSSWVIIGKHWSKSSTSISQMSKLRPREGKGFVPLYMACQWQSWD